MITKKIIDNAFSKLNLKNKCVCVHSSLKSFADEIEGGAETIINAFLENSCTLIVPTFSYEFLIEPPENLQYKRNGYDYSKKNSHNNEKIFTPDTNEISKDEMGLIPYMVLKIKERVRGNHPVCSFSGVGPFASEIIKTQQPMDVFAPLRELALFKGYVLLIGVGLNKMSALHLAEQMAGRNMFIRWALNSEKKPVTVECGGCSEGFDKLDEFLNDIDKKIIIGKSLWRLFPLDILLKRAARVIQLKKEITHCDNKNCIRCNDMIAGGTILN